MLKSAGLRANTSSLAALFLSRGSSCTFLPVQGIILHLSSCPGGHLAALFLSRGIILKFQLSRVRVLTTISHCPGGGGGGGGGGANGSGIAYDEHLHNGVRHF